MTPALERLVALARLDAKLQGLEQSLQKIPERENKAKTRLADAKSALEAHKDRVRQLERRRRESEVEVESLVAQERKYQGQTMQVKTNEELWALQREIQSVKARRSEIETKVLEGMEEEDARKRESAGFDRGVSEAQAQLAEVTSTGAEERARLEAERDALRAERAAVIAGLTREWRARYERVLKSRGSPAVVMLMRNACGGCMSAQPPQRVAEARMGELVVVCEFCGRLIVGVEGE